MVYVGSHLRSMHELMLWRLQRRRLALAHG